MTAKNWTLWCGMRLRCGDGAGSGAAPVVEGRDDENVVVQLLMRHNVFAHASHGPPLAKAAQPSVQVIVEFAQSDKSSRRQQIGTAGGHRCAASGNQRQMQSDTLLMPMTQLLLNGASHKRGSRFEMDSNRPPASVVTPHAISVNGFVGHHQGTGTPIGVWIMPDNQRDGRIEHFLRDLIDANDELLPFAETCSRHAKDSHATGLRRKIFLTLHWHPGWRGKIRPDYLMEQH